MSIDKFYTNKDYSKKCIKIALENENFDFIIEPSSGDGSFLHQLPENIDKIGIDIEPDSHGIINQGSLNTARQNSMGKTELVQLYTNYCNFVNSKI